MKAIPIEISKASSVAGRWNRYLNDLIASEISSITRYYDAVACPRSTRLGSDYLLSQVDCPKKIESNEWNFSSECEEKSARRSAVLLNGEFNHHFDVEGLLREMKPKLSRSSRVLAVCYNPYLGSLYRLANFLRLRKGDLPSTFITRVDLANMAKLAGFDIVKIRPIGFFPFRLFGLGDLINGFFSAMPVIRWLAYVNVVTLRPIIVSKNRPSLSVLIPARNEKGNIEAAIQRMPDLGCELEVIFVEGHSKDETWEEIQRVIQGYKGPLKISAYQQTGKGKADAVRLGFSKATGDLLTILDADLTMPPELLGRFYEAYTNGTADFVNGTRLVYPMEGEAMRFLNRLGNIFFAKALSAVLDVRLGDSLCGTKLVTRHDYDRMIAWRRDFGEFDPFGDFELLFPAAILALGVVDIPIRYRARTYGSTNISRFRHGFMLLRMTLIGFFRIRMASR